MFEKKSFDEFVEEVKKGSYIFESSPERLYKMIDGTRFKDGKIYRYGFFEENKYPVLGLTDVIENIKKGLHTAILFDRNDQILLIALIGPTGSGKSEIQKKIVKSKGMLLRNGIFDSLDYRFSKF